MNLLKKLEALENDADEFGFRWGNTDQIIQQIKSECSEISEHLDSKSTQSNRSNLQEEMGDLLHAAFSLCIFCKLNPEDTLEKSLAKFERRLSAVKQLANERGLTNLVGFSFEELMVLWDQAKLQAG